MTDHAWELARRIDDECPELADLDWARRRRITEHITELSEDVIDDAVGAADE
jgi:hypothetical protein